MSFTSMHNDYLDPDIHDAQPEPPCEQCRWGTEGNCVLTVGCQFDPITTAPADPSALDVQVGGGHYKTMAIQPVEYIHKNGIGYIEGSVIKYVSRWRNKNGIEDLKKARHFLDLLIEMEEIK